MRITLIAIGNKMPSWVEQGYNDYAKRLPGDCSLKLLEIPMPKRGKNTDIEKTKLKEAELILSAIPKHDRVIALEVEGQSWSTEKLADTLSDWRMSGDNVSLLVGGPDGLARQCLQRADMLWSLSPLTLPHPLVRVLLAEQLYRAWAINQNHPYHR